jgi:cell volume regulation protein A
MTVEFFLLVGSILLFISILAEKTGYRFGVPTLLLFLVIGMMAGTDGVGIEFNNPFFAQSIGVVALNLILFSGGMSTKYHEVRSIIAQGVVLSTLGVFLTAIITAGFIYWLTQKAFSSITFSFLEALLLASVISDIFWNGTE